MEKMVDWPFYGTDGPYPFALKGLGVGKDGRWRRSGRSGGGEEEEREQGGGRGRRENGLARSVSNVFDGGEELADDLTLAKEKDRIEEGYIRVRRM